MIDINSCGIALRVAEERELHYVSYSWSVSIFSCIIAEQHHYTGLRLDDILSYLCYVIIMIELSH